MRKRFYLGEYHANKLGTLTNDYLDRYNEQYVANTLTVIDGVLIIGVGGAIGYEYATTGTVVLTIGSQSVAQVYEQLVVYAQKAANLSKQTVDHIFKGFVKNNGKVSGVHFEKYLDDGMKVVKRGSTNAYGVYEGDIYLNGNLAKSGSTFFPESWSATQVIDAINQAFNNIKTINQAKNSIIGISDSGIKIEILLDSAGQIVSAYPLLK